MHCSKISKCFYLLLELHPGFEQQKAALKHLKHCPHCQDWFLAELQWELKLHQHLYHAFPPQTWKNSKKITQMLSKQLKKISPPPKETPKLTHSKNCQKHRSLKKLIANPQLKLQGFYINLLHPWQSLLQFSQHHHRFTLQARLLVPSLSENKNKNEKPLLLLQTNCPLYCLEPDNLELCPHPCALADVRKIISCFRKK
ncbi:MAG: hypothetical protein D6805_10170 [Planctomycetota bacterium]|nr:MAG: hypothetical protein D6805_10170 [Planctomycetota bacterium]